LTVMLVHQYPNPSPSTLFAAFPPNFFRRAGAPLRNRIPPDMNGSNGNVRPVRPLKAKVVVEGKSPSRVSLVFSASSLPAQKPTLSRQADALRRRRPHHSEVGVFAFPNRGERRELDRAQLWELIYGWERENGNVYHLLTHLAVDCSVSFARLLHSTQIGGKGVGPSIFLGGRGQNATSGTGVVSDCDDRTVPAPQRITSAQEFLRVFIVGYNSTGINNTSDVTDRRLR
jgi:hypothetical protein